MIEADARNCGNRAEENCCLKETKISEEELSDRKAIVFAEEKDRFLRSHFAALLPGWRNLIRFYEWE